MKINNKFLICAMLVLMLFLCISASSAAEPLTEELGADIADELAIDEVSDDAVSASEGGDYETISAAGSDATGGDVISAGENNSTVIVTNATFYNYFDEDGFLNDSVKDKELTFKGEFSNLSKQIILDRAIAVKGDGAVLNDIAFVIDSKDVELNGLTLIANGSLGNLISVLQSNVNLYNLNINYIVDDELANAISVSGTNVITDVNIVNNTIYFESHVTTDEDLTTAINLESAEDILIDNNDITADIPALTVETYDYNYFLMGTCYVNPIRIYESAAVNFTNNKLNVKSNSFDSSYPTIQALYIVGSEIILVKGNNVTMKDEETPEGTATYLYAVECGFSSEISFIENNFDIKTTGGKSGAGSAYALQIATSEAEVIGNTIVCDSNGPNLGIFSAYGFGPARDLVIKDNFLNITGYAAGTSDYALISGIEIQTGYATIYNNTIYSMNKGAYGARYPVTAISAVQYSASTLSFDIKDNEVYTNGRYAVDIRYKVNNANVTGNYMEAYALKGDDAAYIKSGTGNVIENNYPTVGVVNNTTFFNFFDENGVLKDNKNYLGLIFDGNFSNLVDTIVINKAFKAIGNNTVLDNIAVRIEADNVELSGFTINANKSFADNNGAAIYATGSDIEIEEVFINYAAPSEADAIAIYANAADNFDLTNSEIKYVSTNPGSKYNYGLELRDSTNVLIKDIIIDAVLPAADVNWNGAGIDQDLVLAVGIQSGENISFIDNAVFVTSNGAVGYYPTLDAVMVDSADNVVFISNTISIKDVKTVNATRYYYALDLYNVSAIVEENNIMVNTTSGVGRSGAAYPVQITGPSTVVVNDNYIYSTAKGPVLGVYAANAWNKPGPSDLTVTNNFINITGNAAIDSSGKGGLVSGIDSSVVVNRIYNNTIYAQNIADYDNASKIYGISYAQSGSTSFFDIQDNIVTTNGKYAVYLKQVANSTVVYNTLYANELEGDDSVLIAAGENNTVENNQPPYHFNVIIDVNGTWVGYDIPVAVTVENATGALGTGKLRFVINGTEFTIKLVDGQANYKISSELVSPGENEIFVEFISDNETHRSSFASAKFYIVDGIVNQDNYMVYFNQDDNGKFFDYVPEGVTLDFQGSIINPDKAITVQMNVNKPVNIISSTGDAYVDLNTTAGSLLGESPGNSFAITKGGSGTNVTGINFHNTQLWFSNTHNVILDNISNVVEDQNVGSGVGATSIRDNSSNVLLKNSYFYTRNNGGSTTFTMSWATNCTIDNCTVKAEGNVGNLIYLNIYNIAGAPSGVPLNNYNTVSNNKIYGKEGSGISVGLMVEGTNNLIVNNTLYKASISNSFGAQKPANNTYVGNIMTEGGSLTAQANSIVYGNNATGSLTTGSKSIAYDNIVGKSMTVTAGSTAYNNTVATSMSVAADSIAYENTVGTSMSVAAGATVHENIIGTSMTVAKDATVYHNIVGTTVAINGANAVVAENNIGGAVTIAKAATNTTLIACIINDTVTVNSNDNNIKENDINTAGDYAIDLKTSTGNNVTLNNLIAPVNKGDASVKYTGANIVENNTPVGIVTNKTFFYYFDENGVLKASEDYTGLIFKGPFSNLVDTIVFNKALEVSSDDAVLDNIAVRIEADNVSFAGFTINADKEFKDTYGAAIYATGSNIGIGMVVINYTAPSDADAFAIFADTVNGFVLTDSEINFTATNHNWTNQVHQYGLHVVDSDNVEIIGNGFNAVLPALKVDYSLSGIYSDLIATIAVQDSDNVSISYNVLDTVTDGAYGSYPTIDSLLVNGADNLVIDNNDISHIDLASESSRYYYTVDLYNFNGTVENNDIIVNTTAGVDRAGTAYSIQLTGPYTATVKNNNLTAVSKGPTHAIYTAAWSGAGDLTVENNNIDVTGYATTGNYALVSGIEAEIEVLKAYNNTIVVKNTAAYDDANQVYGISMASSWFSKDVSADIKYNDITVDGKYAVYYLKAVNTNVTYNTLYANELAGDDAVLVAAGENTTVEFNQPPFLFDVIIDVNGSWVGYDVPVTVTVVNATGGFPTGKASFKINDTEFIIKLVDGKANYRIPAELLALGENEIVVDYISDNVAYKGESASAKFTVIDGIVTQDTYILYFNQDDNGKLFDYVPEGATLDFQGSIINPDQKITVQMNVNKPVNIISSTGDAYVDLNTTAGSLLGESPGNSFAITNGGSGSNVTGINFHNTQLWFSNTHNVILDNISNVVEDQNVGSGVGATSIRDNSSNVVLKNSYFYTKNNGGSSTFTLSWTTNCTIDNCTVKAEGNVGNLIYLNIFNIVGAPSDVPLNNYNTVSNNRIYGKEGSGISVGLVVEGTNNLIVNNTLYKASIGIPWGGGVNPANNTYVGNTLTEGGSLTAQANSIVYGNNVTGSLTTGAGSLVHDNIVEKSMTVAKDAFVYHNIIGTTVSINGANAVVAENNIGGAVTIAKAATNTTLIGGIVNGTVTVNSNDNNIKENYINSTGDYAIDLKATTGNNVTYNYLVSKLYNGDAAVKYTGENNTIEENDPRIEMTVVADSVWIGYNGAVTVNVVNGTGNVTIKVNNKTYIVELDENGTATQAIPDEDLVVGANNVTVTYEAKGFLPKVIDTELANIDGIITNATYKFYFDASGNLAAAVPDDAILDFQGLFLGKYPVYINKPVHVVSSTGDALFDSGATYAGNNINSFNIVAGGDNTNITGLKFINYCLYIKGASNVTVDDISIVANKRGVGSGTGFLSIHTGANNTLVKNSYFENGGTGSSLLVLGKGGAYATFDHNVFNITGSSGNILSANQFVGTGAAPEHVSYTNNVLYNSQPGSAFCYAMTVSGSGNLVENNTIYHNGSGILNQYGASSSGNVYRNNTLYGNTNFNPSANSIVQDNKIYATTNIAANTTVLGNTFLNVAISGTDSVFAYNEVNGTVTVKGNNNTIAENTIISTGDYAVDLQSTTGNDVSANYLISSLYKGDAAVKYTNEDNFVEDNDPRIEMTVAADAVWIGSNGTVTVNVVNGTGNVTVKVNNKTYTVELDENGTATQVIPAEDLVAGANNVTVTYEPEGFLPEIIDTQLALLGGVITNETYKFYFDEKGNLNAAVPDGAILDFQGLFLGKFPVYIDKSVNVISSTGDALFDAGETYAGNAINSFNIIAGGDNTNITGLDFINCCLYIKGASNVTVDDISIVANKRGVGSGTGFLSIHTGANNTLVKNSYFENGGTGSSLLVLGKGGAYATFDHNVFNITGSSGNILSANQFVGTGAAPEHVSYTNNVLYNSQPGSAFCYAMTVSGSGNLVENNTIYHNGSGILNQYGASSSGNVYRNNTLYGNTNFNPSANSIVENNKIYATTNIAANTTVLGNTFLNVAISGTNTKFMLNNVSGTVTVKGNENIIVANVIVSDGEYAVDLQSTVNNTVTENVLYASELYSDAAVKYDNENNTVEGNAPFDAGLNVEVNDIFVGEDAVVNITFTQTVYGYVEVIVDGKSYTVNIFASKGQLIVPGLAASTYSVSATYLGNILHTPSENATKFTVSKIETEGNVTIGEVVPGQDVPVTIAIPGVTGNVSVIVDGVETIVPLDENGTANYTIPAITAGDHSIVVVYSGDETHAPVVKTAAFNVEVFSSEFTNLTVSGDLVIKGVLVTSLGDPIANAEVTYAVGGVSGKLTTGADGSFNITGASNTVVTIDYAGTSDIDGSNISIKFENIAPARLASQFNVTAGTSVPTYAVDFSMKEPGINFKFRLTDSEGNPIVNATVDFAYKTVYFNRTTDEDGCVNLGINTQVAGEYLCALSYLGDETHNATFVPFSFNIQKKSMSISASAKSYKASAKTKKYTVTLKTQKSVDGKTYLKPGKKVTLKINGKTYTAKTNDKGQATFSIKLTKKGKFTAKVSFEGDKTYEAASKSVKITLK